MGQSLLQLEFLLSSLMVMMVMKKSGGRCQALLEHLQETHNMVGLKPAFGVKNLRRDRRNSVVSYFVVLCCCVPLLVCMWQFIEHKTSQRSQGGGSSIWLMYLLIAIYW